MRVLRPPDRRIAALRGAARRLVRDRRAGTAIEFSLLALPFLTLCLGFLQALALHYTQGTLTNTLYAIASQPLMVAAPANAASYKDMICNKNAFVANCQDNIKIERWKLENLPVAVTAIGNAEWQGQSRDVVVVRVVLPVLQFTTLIPTLTAKESVIFRLP